MPLSTSEKLVFEEWTGPVDGDDLAAAHAYFDDLGGAGKVYALAAALRFLRWRRGQFAFQVGDVASASDRANHARNFDWIQSQIDKLMGVLGLLDLPPGLDDLLDEGEAAAVLRPVQVSTANPRLR